MKTGLTAAFLLLAAIPASAHRLDEYLQAALISVDGNGIQVEMTLTPGVAVFPAVLAGIDTDRDGILSDFEQQAYAARVLRDLSLAIDGHRLTPRLVSMKFPAIDEIQQGRGAIEIVFRADAPARRGSRTLTIENHHQSAIAAYMVNCLVPQDPDIRVIAQNRNYSQSRYELDYAQTGTLSLAAFGEAGWLVAPAFLLMARFVYLWRRRERRAQASDF
jgi:hypothetical protein